MRQLSSTHDATVVELAELRELYKKTKQQAEALIEKQKRFEEGLRNAAAVAEEPGEPGEEGEEVKAVDPAVTQMKGAIAVLMDERARAEAQLKEALEKVEVYETKVRAWRWWVA